MLIKQEFEKKVSLDNRKKIIDHLKHGLCPNCGSDMIAEDARNLDYCSNVNCPFSSGNELFRKHPWLKLYHRYK